jgi:type VI secretion system secreted protein VgrG
MTARIRLVNPLGDVLQFARLHAAESLGQLFEFELDVVSERGDVRADEVLGRPFTVSVRIDGDRERHFNGYAVRIASGAAAGRLASYRISLRPWLWFLTRTSDCKVFQKLDVPAVLNEVFETEPTARFDRRGLAAQYEPWEYCVQYRETDFNFVSRLMEQEGIYYWFEHAADGHTLVMADGGGAHRPIEGDPSVVYRSESRGAMSGQDHVQRFEWAQELQPGKYAIDDYDFRRPGFALDAVRLPERPPRHDKADYEVFDYPGEHDTPAEGERYAASRMEELRAQAEVFSGVGSERDLAVGRRFTLTDHPRSDLNGEYLVTSTSISIEEDARESGSGGGFRYEVAFAAIPARQTFRSPRSTPKPVVQGVQTAVVVGPSGEEIHTDEHGRIRVQFHWDRYGPRDETSSCFVRVATPWAGAGFGMVSIPRIGHEVVVGFEEGDPDRPLVTGSVYNGRNAPPWALPANATQSGILSRSSKGGSAAHANAIRFEDRKGAEQVWIHAERNQDIEVEHDETHSVGHDRTKSIGHDETITIGHDLTESVGNDEVETIGRNRTVTVGATHAETIGSAMSIVVGGTLTESVALNYAETVGGAMELTVGAVLAITVGGALTETVGGARADTVGGNAVENVGGDRTRNYGGTLTEQVGRDSRVKVGGDSSVEVAKQMRTEVTGVYMVQAKRIQISAEDEINLKCGGAEIVLKKNGDITIKGKAINVKGSGDVILKGSKVTAN